MTQAQLKIGILEYIQTLSEEAKKSGSGDSTELEAALASLSKAFKIDLGADKSQTIKPATLEAIFAVGHKQVAAAVAHLNTSNTSSAPAPSASKEKTSATTTAATAAAAAPTGTKEEQFEAFVKDLTTKGYFQGTLPGSAEYNARLEKAKQKFDIKHAATAAATTPPPAAAKPEADAATIAKAEALKEEGNKKLASKDYKEAKELYSQAIDLHKSHIYYSNRAAALTHLEDYRGAIADCIEAARIEPNYSKAYSRLGLAYYSIGEYDKAITEGYDKVLKLEPNNESAREGKERCVKAKKSGGAGSSATGGGGGAGGMPGGFDFASMMNNPQFMNMAAQVMQNPQMQQMMAGMMAGGAGSGMPGFGGGGATNNNANASPSFEEASAAAAAQARSSGAGGSSGFDVDAAAAAAAADPAMSQFANNPKMRRIAEEVRAEGPMAAMKYMNDPEVMGMIQQLMSNGALNNNMMPPRQ